MNTLAIMAADYYDNDYRRVYVVSWCIVRRLSPHYRGTRVHRGAANLSIIRPPHRKLRTGQPP